MPPGILKLTYLMFAGDGEFSSERHWVLTDENEWAITLQLLISSLVFFLRKAVNQVNAAQKTTYWIILWEV